MTKIRGIEELKNYNEREFDLASLKDKIVTFTNKNDEKMTVLLTNYNDYELKFNVKILNNNKILINELFYPVYFVKDIVIYD